MNRSEAVELIAGQASRGELVFPTNMAASLKLQQALDDPDCHLETAAELVLAEPLTAARLVAIANSVAYTRFGGKVNNVRSAVSLLGFKPLRSLVAAIVVRQFSSEIKNPAIRHQSELLWHHSANVAALAKVIARKLTKLDPETALFSGIVHEIAGFYLFSRAEEFPALLEVSPAADRSSADAQLAHAILQALKVPKPVSSAVEGVFAGNAARPPLSLGDVLSLANELASIHSPLSGPFSDSAVDFPVGDTTLRAVLDESADDIKAMTDALMT